MAAFRIDTDMSVCRTPCHPAVCHLALLAGLAGEQRSNAHAQQLRDGQELARSVDAATQHAATQRSACFLTVPKAT